MNRVARRRALALWLIGLAVAAVLLAMGWGWLRHSPPVNVAQGVFWQPALDSHAPHGNWEQLGVSHLLVQFSAVDGRAWFPNAYLPPWQPGPDWRDLRRQPWARSIIFGLAGRFDEVRARAAVEHLGRLSALLAQHTPLPAAGYYFPVEADPSWQQAAVLRSVLTPLPRPLWVSVYANAIAPEQLADWVASWLPDDVGVMLQDGVGTGVRAPARALALLKALQQRLGKRRVILIAEMFRSAGEGRLKPAWVWQQAAQLQAYRGEKVYLFDGPHNLPAWHVWLLKLWFKLTG